MMDVLLCALAARPARSSVNRGVYMSDCFTPVYLTYFSLKFYLICQYSLSAKASLKKECIFSSCIHYSLFWNYDF
jgi:hypothetical protein